MAGMSGRFSTVIKAKINRMLDKAEDPGDTLEYSYQKQMELLQQVKKGISPGPRSSASSSRRVSSSRSTSRSPSWSPSRRR